MNTLGTRRSSASGTLGAIHGWKSGAVSVWVVDGTLSRSITPGSDAAAGAGVGAGACVWVGRVGCAGAGRLGRRGVAGMGVGAMTRISGSVVSCCASTALGAISAAMLTHPERPNESLRLKILSLRRGPTILVPTPTQPVSWLPRFHIVGAF